MQRLSRAWCSQPKPSSPTARKTTRRPPPPEPPALAAWAACTKFSSSPVTSIPKGRSSRAALLLLHVVSLFSMQSGLSYASGRYADFSFFRVQALAHLGSDFVRSQARGLVVDKGRNHQFIGFRNLDEFVQSPLHRHGSANDCTGQR